jgi:hypothetical protein
MEDHLSDDQLQKMLQFMATEHSVLQAGRSATIFETGGRTAVFLGTVSSTLIALAFVGQISRLGTAFFAFALVLLPTLFFLGLVTFERATQLGVEDYIYAVGMSRIRHFYVEMVPQAEKYFVGSIHDDLATTMAPTLFGMPVSLAWQSLLTVPGAIALVNSVIVGSFAALLVRAFLVESVALSVGVGIAAFVVSAFLQRRHQIARWNQIEQRLPTLFPSEPTP